MKIPSQFVVGARVYVGEPAVVTHKITWVEPGDPSKITKIEVEHANEKRRVDWWQCTFPETTATARMLNFDIDIERHTRGIAEARAGKKAFQRALNVKSRRLDVLIRQGLCASAINAQLDHEFPLLK